jgi:hypothetical protein
VTRIGDVEQPVRDKRSLVTRRLRGRRIEAAVDLEGVATDDLPAQPKGDKRCEPRFPGAGRAANDQDRRLYFPNEREILGRDIVR